jgi:S-adenosylmethionine-diacylgycerolhomoserine-N-methlytransferase
MPDFTLQSLYRAMVFPELQTIASLLRGMPPGDSHQQRLEGFYARQAAGYDNFRARLLAGRGLLVDELAPAPGESLIELGAGTGCNVAWYEEQLDALGQVTLVDLCPSLLSLARKRWANRPNVVCVEADACSWQPSEPADIVMLSYSLSMIPDWISALQNAHRMLKPGGRIGVCDFHVGDGSSRGVPGHGWLSRWFWPRWFSHDGVKLDPAHLPTLRRGFTGVAERVAWNSMPWMPGVRVSWYLFVGIKELAITDIPPDDSLR